jgi:hypothetical protein
MLFYSVSIIQRKALALGVYLYSAANPSGLRAFRACQPIRLQALHRRRLIHSHAFHAVQFGACGILPLFSCAFFGRTCLVR